MPQSVAGDHRAGIAGGSLWGPDLHLRPAAAPFLPGLPQPGMHLLHREHVQPVGLARVAAPRNAVPSAGADATASSSSSVTSASNGTCWGRRTLRWSTLNADSAAWNAFLLTKTRATSGTSIYAHKLIVHVEAISLLEDLGSYVLRS